MIKKIKANFFNLLTFQVTFLPCFILAVKRSHNTMKSTDCQTISQKEIEAINLLLKTNLLLPKDLKLKFIQILS